MSKTLDEVMICPYCGSNDCFEWSTDEISFAFGDAHYYVDCTCRDCGISFRLYAKFEYNITESYTR